MRNGFKKSENLFENFVGCSRTIYIEGQILVVVVFENGVDLLVIGSQAFPHDLFGVVFAMYEAIENFGWGRIEGEVVNLFGQGIGPASSYPLECHSITYVYR